VLNLLGEAGVEYRFGKWSGAGSQELGRLDSSRLTTPDS